MINSKILRCYPNIVNYFLNKEDIPIHFELKLINDKCIKLEQIHSNKIAYYKDNQKFYQSVDGLISKKKIHICIKTADCLPIFFYEEKYKIIAAIHAGWRGLYNDIILNTVQKIQSIGGNKQQIKVVIGPHIGGCCYEVSHDLLLLFQKKINKENVISNRLNNKYFLDLGKYSVIQLEKLGIFKQNIELINVCTYCDDRYYSYRKNGEKCGRMLNIIGMT